MQSKAMRSARVSKQTLVAAAKIKHRLNNSSFFKSTLKTNNKALALSLQAEKKKCTLLEKELVDLRKREVACSFDFAAKNYKYRKLLLILKNLYSDTFKHLNLMAELFPEIVVPETPEDHNVHPIEGDDLPDEIPANVAPALTEVVKDSTELCPEFQKAIRLTEKETYNEKRHSNQQALQMESAHQSNILREDLRRFSQFCYDSNSMASPQQSLQTSSALGIASLTEVNAPCNSAAVVPENTVVFNTTMEMTQSNDTEIVTHLPTGGKTQQKQKRNKKKECNKVESSLADSSQGMARADSSVGEIKLGSCETMSHTEDQEQEHTNSNFKAKSQPKIRSRIPKMVKSRVGSHQTVKISQTTENSSHFFSSILDDHFIGQNIFASKPNENALPAEECLGEKRKSRKKSRRRTLIASMISVLPPHDTENVRSTVENNEETANFGPIELEEPSPPNVGSEPQMNPKISAKSGGYSKSRHRSTYVISKAHVKENAELLLKDKDSIQAVEECSDCSLRNVTAAPRSYKRSLVASQDPESLPVDLHCSVKQGNIPTLQQFPVADYECQKPKKVRQKFSSRSRRKKAQHCNISDVNAMDKKNKPRHDNADSPEHEEVCFLYPTDSHFVDEFSFLNDPDVQYNEDGKFKSKSRLNKNSIWYRKTSRLPSTDDGTSNLEQILDISS
ncbi:uncharacterized protein LOC130927187 isoform X2 [Corythoichthys intestinalis]|uniref:uncharacterized protein LOC130927187 isoform X2 n=1 Tax=Corythoichthys intestinalis TaxID=161448 RepID=UPI0025A5AD97|nr:uncharacterized protein sgo2 isoform X2 [Corythoichthys intestinalis]